MQRFARIDSGAIVEIVETDKAIATLFHSGLSWVDVTGQPVAIGDVRKGSSFASPPRQAHPAMPTVAELQAEIARLAARLDALTKLAG
jgi:hypothetical protein